VGHLQSLTRQSSAPDVYALYSLKIDNKESLLVGGDRNLSQWGGDHRNGRVSFEYSIPGRNVFVPVHADWTNRGEHVIRAFAAGSTVNDGAFYMAGRDLINGAYVVRGTIPAAANEHIRWDSHPVGDWRWKAGDIVYSMVNVGGTLYVGGRFTSIGTEINNIAELKNNRFVPLGSGTHKGVTKHEAHTATVNAMLPVAAATVVDVQIGEEVLPSKQAKKGTKR
jgi:hypothetical protein